MTNHILPPTPAPSTPSRPMTPRATTPISRADMSSTIDDDLFPNTAEAIIKPSDPQSIPLPPSPPLAKWIPPRRPKGWISTLPRQDARGSAAISGREDVQHRVGSRTVSARYLSGPSPLMMGGRTVSGAMQYAIQLGQSTVPEAKSGGSESPAEMCATAGTSNDDSERSEHGVPGDPGGQKERKDKQAETISEPDWADSNLEKEERDGMEYDAGHSGSSITALQGHDSDEPWMSYVRQQLGTLFPDFFDGQAGDSHRTDIGGPPSGGLHNGDNSNQHEPGFASDQVEDGAIDWRCGAIRSSKNDESGELPDIRVEIGGLRAEIERLRGVVGDLAIGLQNPTRPCECEPREMATNPAREEEPHSVDMAKAADEDEAAVEAELGDELESDLLRAFMKTAHISVSIVRLIAAAMAESEQSDKEGSVAMTDAAMFSSDNLLRLKAKLHSTLVGNRHRP